MQFLILHKIFRQLEDITIDFENPVDAYKAFIAANPHLVRVRQQLETVVQEAVAQIELQEEVPCRAMDAT